MRNRADTIASLTPTFYDFLQIFHFYLFFISFLLLSNFGKFLLFSRIFWQRWLQIRWCLHFFCRGFKVNLLERRRRSSRAHTFGIAYYLLLGLRLLSKVRYDLVLLLSRGKDDCILYLWHLSHRISLRISITFTMLMTESKDATWCTASTWTSIKLLLILLATSL